MTWLGGTINFIAVIYITYREIFLKKILKKILLLLGQVLMNKNFKN